MCIPKLFQVLIPLLPTTPLLTLWEFTLFTEFGSKSAVSNPASSPLTWEEIHGPIPRHRGSHDSRTHCRDARHLRGGLKGLALRPWPQVRLGGHCPRRGRRWLRPDALGDHQEEHMQQRELRGKHAVIQTSPPNGLRWVSVVSRRVAREWVGGVAWRLTSSVCVCSLAHGNGRALFSQ